MFYLTQSLLSSWRHYLDSDDTGSDAALDSFLSVLQRKKQEPTPAMQAGRDFEAAINAVVARKNVELDGSKEARAVLRFSRLCAGGQPQVPIAGTRNIAGLEFRLYGVCDYVKAGTIYDIKRVQRYEYGKYFHSPQHAMYMELIPAAKKFVYLIFNGADTFTETYRREDTPPIEETIREFVRWLGDNRYMNLFENHWTMNDERMELTHGI